MKLWQLINPQTGEKLSGLQELPENWGPIFGMAGVKDRLNDLSWLGINDQCWVEVDVPDVNIDPVKLDIDERISNLMNQANEVLAQPDKLTKGQWQNWTDYQIKLQNIPLQAGYPNEILWPTKPE